MVVNELLRTNCGSQACSTSTWRAEAGGRRSGAERCTVSEASLGYMSSKNAWGRGGEGFKEKVASEVGLGEGVRIFQASKIVRDILGALNMKACSY